MTTNTCKAIRRQIDEADLNQQLTAGAADHLRVCAQCRNFEAEQRALQGLIASLDTIAAPSDFDFRLRARLAREKGRSRSGFGGRLSIVPRPIVVAALVLLIAVAGVVVKNRLASRGSLVSTAVKAPVRVENSSGKGTATTNSAGPNTPVKESVLVIASNTGGGSRKNAEPIQRHPASSPQKNAPRSNSVLARKGEATATREFSGSPAPVLLSDPNREAGAMVLVPLDARALKISIDDGRGTSRTISLPTVSFGSQRLMARESFLPSVSSPKGVW